MKNRNQRLDEYGHEVLSDDEVVARTRLRMPASQVMRIRNIVRQEFSQQAENAGYESFEDADDFEIPEGEGDWVSPYEEVFEPPLSAEQAPEAQPAASTAAAPSVTPASAGATSDAPHAPVSEGNGDG